jgi:predicted dienelactone hydrolase
MRPLVRVTFAALLSLVIDSSCMAKGASSQARFAPPKGAAAVPEGKDVISLSQGSKVGYRVLQVSATDALGKRTTTDVAVWYPTSDEEAPFSYEYGENSIRTRLARDGRVASGRFPVVVFSHGATGSGLTSAFVTETLARHGFIVAAVDHTDEVYLARIRPEASPQRQRGQAVRALTYAAKVRNKWLGDEAVAHREELSYRPAQVRAAIDLLVSPPKGSPFEGHADADKVAVMGHSFGAWTAMVVAGAVKPYADPRVRAAVTLSAPVNGTVFSPKEVAQIKVPFMLFFGSTEVRQGRGDDRTHFYDHLSGPKYMVEIDGAVHTTFSGGVREEHPTLQGYLEDENRAAITRYVIAFLSYHLKGDAAAHRQLQVRGSGVTNYLYDE